MTNQPEFNLLYGANPRRNFASVRKLGVSPMAWSPLAGGRLFDPENVAARACAAAKGMSSRYNAATLEQLAYAWILAPESPAADHRHKQTDRLHRVRKRRHVLAGEDWYALGSAGSQGFHETRRSVSAENQFLALVNQ